MFKIFFVVILGFAVSLARASEEKITIEIGYYSLPPHAMLEEGVASGTAVRYLSESVFPRTKYKLIWKFYPFARVLEELKQNSLDAGILIAKTEERAKLFRFPQKYLYETKSGLIMRNDDMMTRIETLDQLKGMILGHVTNSVRPIQLSQSGVIFEDLSGSDTFTRNITKLTRKRINAIYVPTLSHGMYQLNERPNVEGLHIAKLPIDGYKLYTVFRRDIDQAIIDEYERNADQRYYETYIK
jgi:ABC-type amino acid transport substrate-binding protein